MSDARIADQVEGSEERPRGGAALKAKVEALRQAERTRKAKLEAEQRQGEEREISEIQSARWGMSSLNRKLIQAAEVLQARFSSDDVEGLLSEFEQNGHKSITLAEGTSDEFLGSTLNAGATEWVAVANADPADVAEAENAFVQRYRELASGTAPLRLPKEKYVLQGARKKAEANALLANQTELAHLEQQAKSYVGGHIEFAKRTLGFKQLNATLAQAGFQLEVINEGPVLKFVAVPIPEQLAQPVAGPKESFTPQEVQDEIARALAEKQATEQASADAAELVRLKAADVELKDLKAKLPEMLEAAADKAVARALAQEDRVHAAIIALAPNLPPAVLERLKRPAGSSESE